MFAEIDTYGKVGPNPRWGLSPGIYGTFVRLSIFRFRLQPITDAKKDETGIPVSSTLSLAPRCIPVSTLSSTKMKPASRSHLSLEAIWFYFMNIEANTQSHVQKKEQMMKQASRSPLSL